MTTAEFSEKDFYLQEFRGRTLAIAIPGELSARARELDAVLDELRANGTRVVLIVQGGSAGLDGHEVVHAAAPRLEGAVWRALRRRPVVVVTADDLAAACLTVATRLRLFKLVRIGEHASVRTPAGGRRSFVDLPELERILSAGDDVPGRDLLREIEALLRAGVPNVNLCELGGLGDELFSYSGSGTLFTSERYVEVRRLGIEDFDAAADLIARGVEEGYLAPRDEPAVDALLADGYGAFAGGQHLAGIAALRIRAGVDAGEIASLYTLTRFAGEGIGRHIVGSLVARAADEALAYVYACTTSDRAAAFFERNGFAEVPHDRVPAEKWSGYDPARRAQIRCFRRELSD